MLEQYLNQKVVVDLRSPYVCLGKLHHFDEHFLDVRNAEYGVWRPVYQRHAYRDLNFADVPENTRYAFSDSAPPKAADYPKPLAPVDDLPPVTVVTHVRPSGAGARQHTRPGRPSAACRRRCHPSPTLK